MRAALIAAVLAAALAACYAQTADDQNTYSAMVRRSAACATKYSDLEAKYYANDATCREAVKKALSTYVVKDCPATTKDSVVWTCMSGYNTTTKTTDAVRIDDWKTFVRGCEILYIANRVDNGESEDGFVWKDNSCFPRFNDLSSFIRYLNSGEGGARGGSAGSVRASAAALVAGAGLVLAMLWQ